MKRFAEYEKEVFSLINENDHYIIFNDCKAILNNVDEIGVDIDVANSFDCYDICKRKRPKEENIISQKAKFTTMVSIHQNIDLKIVHVNDQEKAMNLVFDVDEHVQARIMQIYLHIDIEMSSLIEINCNEHSQVQYIYISHAKEPIHEYINTYLDESATLSLSSLSMNETSCESYFHSYLYSEKAKAEFIHCLVNFSSKNQDYSFQVDHLKPHTYSSMRNYGLAKNSSTMRMDSNGSIAKGAFQSELSQKSKGIILDLHSAISANPLLQIDEYDVLANHGASIGAIDDDDLYYLMSRGLSRSLSESLIVNAFITPFISQIQDEKVHLFLEKMIEEHV